MLDRRTFAVRSLAAAGSLASVPALLARLFAAEQDPQPKAGEAPAPGSPRALLAEAIARAKAEDKPLLVFFVPAEMRARWARGQRLGALCTHNLEFQRELALTVPVCAARKDLEALLPDAKLVGEPLMFLVEPGDKAPAVPIDVPYQEPPALTMVEASVVRADLDALAAATVAALRPDAQALERLAQRMRAHADAATIAAIGAWLDGGPLPTDAQLVRAAAWVRQAASAMPKAKAEPVLAALDAAIHRLLVEPRVPGGRWQKVTPCGLQPEDPMPGENVLGAPCGTGCVQPLSERFLSFLTER